MASHNGTTSPLTIDHLRTCEIGFSTHPRETAHLDTSIKAIIKRSINKFSLVHVKALWSTTRLAYSTTLVVLLWGIIGLAYPLYNVFLLLYLEKAGIQYGWKCLITYRNHVIISVSPHVFPLLTTGLWYPRFHHRRIRN